MAERVGCEISCTSCFHYDACFYHITEETTLLTVNECPLFVNKADVAQVRHGEWIDDKGERVPFDEHYNEGCAPKYSCYCSVCGEWLTASDEYAVFGRYCPSCGAKMDGKGER